MKREKKKVAVIGALNVDIGGLPESRTAPGDSIPGRVRTTLGGVGWNMARDLGSLGLEVRFFSVLGEDIHAAAIRAEALAYGVDLAGCRWERAENNRYLYIADGAGDIAAAVNDMALCRRMDGEFIASILPLAGACDVMVTEANLPAEALEALAAGAGNVPLAADGVSAAKCGRLRGCLPRLHTLKVNRLEAETLTGRADPAEAARALLAAGTRRVVISLGAEGVLCGEGEALYRLPASGAPRDATGAGDSLTAALAAGAAWGLPLARCAALGLRAAAITMEEPGAVTPKLAALAPEKTKETI